MSGQRKIPQYMIPWMILSIDALVVGAVVLVIMLR